MQNTQNIGIKSIKGQINFLMINFVTNHIHLTL